MQFALLKEGRIAGDQAWQPGEEGFTVSSSEDGDWSPDEKEELQMEEKHEEEGYKEFFHVPTQKGEHSEAVLQWLHANAQCEFAVLFPLLCSPRAVTWLESQRRGAANMAGMLSVQQLLWKRRGHRVS